MRNKGKILSVHSYRGGTGKSNLSANLAYQAVLRGKRVAVLDTDLQSPGVHMILGLPPERMTNTLSDYLFGKCELEEAAYNLSNDLDIGDKGGALYLLPSSMKVDAIVRIASDGYDSSKLNDHFGPLMEDLARRRIGRSPPSRVSVWSSSTRSSFACTGDGSSPTSSRNSVPSVARSNAPLRSRSAMRM